MSLLKKPNLHTRWKKSLLIAVSLLLLVPCAAAATLAMRFEVETQEPQEKTLTQKDKEKLELMQRKERMNCGAVVQLAEAIEVGLNDARRVAIVPDVEDRGHHREVEAVEAPDGEGGGGNAEHDGAGPVDARLPDVAAPFGGDADRVGRCLTHQRDNVVPSAEQNLLAVAHCAPSRGGGDSARRVSRKRII